MVLQRSCQSADVQAAWWLSTEWWNQSRSGIHKCFPKMVYIFTNTHTYINMYGYTHEHMHRHKKPLWISENPKDAHRLVFISICTEKKYFLVLFLDTEKHQCFLQLLEIFSACAVAAFLRTQGIMEIPKTDGAATASGGTALPRPGNRRAFQAYAENSDSVQVFGEQMSIMNHMITLPYFSWLCSLT